MAPGLGRLPTIRSSKDSSSSEAPADKVPSWKASRLLGGGSDKKRKEREKQEEEEKRQREHTQLILAYSVAIGKAIAGGLRFFLEDWVSGLLQLVYLCKLWHRISESSKMFTLFSVCSGVIMSFIGPLRELSALRRAKRAAHEHGAAEHLAIGPDKELDEDAGLDIELKNLIHGHIEKDEEAPEEGDIAGGGKAKAPLIKARPQTIVPIRSLRSAIQGGSQGGSQRPRQMLLVGAAVFWFLMILLPFVLKLDCGKPMPSSGHLVFFCCSSLLSLMEVWITMQTEQGYLMFKRLRRRYAFGYIVGHLGRFDTYSDVMFAGMIHNCEPIHSFSIKGHKIWLPLQLDHMVLIVLVVGVLLSQALPGLILLANRTRYLPLALKLNEYTLLLAVMEAEVLPEAREQPEGEPSTSMRRLTTSSQPVAATAS